MRDTMRDTANSLKKWRSAMALISFFFFVTGTTTAFSQGSDILKINKIKPVPKLKKTLSEPESSQKVQQPTPFQDEGDHPPIDGNGTLYRIDMDSNEAVIGDSIMPLSPNIKFHINGTSYDLPPKDLTETTYIAYTRDTKTKKITDIWSFTETP